MNTSQGVEWASIQPVALVRKPLDPLFGVQDHLLGFEMVSDTPKSLPFGETESIPFTMCVYMYIYIYIYIYG